MRFSHIMQNVLSHSTSLIKPAGKKQIIDGPKESKIIENPCFLNADYRRD